MKGMILYLTIAIFGEMFIAALAASCSSSCPSSSQNGIGKSIESFGVALYNAAVTGKTGNVIISPFSIETCLSLLYCGAGGKTEGILQNVLGYGKWNQSFVAQTYQAILKPFQQSILDIATAIYVSKEFTVQPSFDALATVKFYSSIMPINFSQQNRAASKINQWVEARTQDKITNIVKPSDIGADTAMVLVNAVYFKGKWKTQFDKDNTYPDKFRTGQCTANEFENIPMMHLTTNFNGGYVPFLDSNVIQIPYSQSGISMVIILPTACKGLPIVESLLHLFNFNQINNEYLNNGQTILTMPKFTIDFSVELNDPLKSVGLKNIFGYNANFTNILETQNENPVPLYVSKVIQKAHIEVDESGTEAAAATAVFTNFMMPEPAMPPPPPFVFNADHPFIYMLIDSSEILFMGRFTG